ncbi:MAG: hypothetical protein IIB66_11940 [Proteobacteria bacterium]|nr:hypothetical protein [Pseudomonadota bacterium]
MTAAPHDTSRLEILRTRPNPNREIDYVVVLEGTVRPRGVAAPLGLTLYYVPDRLIIESGEWRRYLADRSAEPMPALEELAARILSDTNNEVVPRWLSVVVCGDASGPLHKVVIEDRQPTWDNPALLRRIPHI